MKAIFIILMCLATNAHAFLPSQLAPSTVMPSADCIEQKGGNYNYVNVPCAENKAAKKIDNDYSATAPGGQSNSTGSIKSDSKYTPFVAKDMQQCALSVDGIMFGCVQSTMAGAANCTKTQDGLSIQCNADTTGANANSNYTEKDMRKSAFITTRQKEFNAFEASWRAAEVYNHTKPTTFAHIYVAWLEYILTLNTF